MMMMLSVFTQTTIGTLLVVPEQHTVRRMIQDERDQIKVRRLRIREGKHNNITTCQNMR